MGDVSFDPGAAAGKGKVAINGLKTCQMLKESKSTCVVKVKLNVVDARFCDAW